MHEHATRPDPAPGPDDRAFRRPPSVAEATPRGARVGHLSALGQADRGGRERLAASIQRSAGNRAMARLLPIQRWAVPAPADADCNTLISSVNASTPYSPEWAKTQANFPYSYDYTVSGNTAQVINGTVSHTAPVDMPEWAPSDPAMQTAWTNAHTTLRAHEQRHQDIAATWEGTLRTNLNGLSVTFSNPSEINGLVTTEWNNWIADHQADQTAIDPYTVNVACPAPPEATEGGEDSEGSEGGEGGE
jgi:predicted secreted Zn-dependent protease